MDSPLVSIICLCFNHEKYVRSAIQSVLEQNYQNIELIVVDDFSTDGSVREIEQSISAHPKIRFIKNDKNLGNCRAFNRAFKESSGEFIIDLSADDLLLPDRVADDVKFLNSFSKEYGVIYSDARYIDQNDKLLGNHFSGSEPKVKLDPPPYGDVYRDVISKYFIAAPTMTIRREVLEELNGYDESLSYEDFDFWVRSSRTWKYAYHDKVNTAIRVLESSMSRSIGKKGDQQLRSTLEVCRKIRALNQNKNEDAALKKRVFYQFTEAMRFRKFNVAFSFLRMWLSL